MPCDAIATTTAQIPLDLERELENVGAETVAQALLALLRPQLAHLGDPKLDDVYGNWIYIRIGTCRIQISRVRWTVTVTDYGQNWQVVQQLSDAVTGTLTGLARLARQKRIGQAIRQAGYRVSAETRAANGAVVLNVDL